MRENWIAGARGELQGRQAPDGSWSYRPGRTAGAEPTAMAALGLLATGDDRPVEVRRAGEWLAGLQREVGSVPATPGVSMPGWTTPHALLLWGRLGGFEESRRRAREWLLRVAGKRMPAGPETRSTLGHDPTLVGWPWVAGTHSWVEPTAMAILALRGESLGDHPRARAGLAVIVDRAIPSGGWNYGNKSVFGRVLRPQPGPTGQALLAITDGAPVVGPAIDYLLGVLPTTRAAVSIGWGVMGLKAHGACPPGAASWLAEAAESCSGRPDATLGLGLLLVAAASPAP